MSVQRTTLRLVGLAFAQLALIVTGVTLALWADSRVESRKDRSTEAARLESLAENVDRTRARLENHAAELRGVSSALSRLASMNDAAELPGTEELDTLIGYGLLGIPDFSPELNAYEDLKSSGELGLLKDPELRNALSGMDADTQRVLDARADLIQYQQRLVDPWLIANLDLGWLLPDLPEGAGAEGRLPGSAYAYADILGQRELRNLIAFKIDLLDNIARSQAELDAALERARAEIGRRLRELR